jgi:hypothetical protein
MAALFSRGGRYRISTTSGDTTLEWALNQRVRGSNPWRPIFFAGNSDDFGSQGGDAHRLGFAGAGSLPVQETNRRHRVTR